MSHFMTHSSLGIMAKLSHTCNFYEKIDSNERLTYKRSYMATDTRKNIMRVAEELFAEHGFSNTSLRHITSRAGVNLASVNYHFGSKEALITAVLATRLVPMNAERLSRLNNLQATKRLGDEDALEQLVRAFVGPALELSRDQDKGGAIFIRMLGRTYTEPNETVNRAVRQMYIEVVDAFRPAFKIVLTDVSDDDLYWRMHFMIGALAYLMSGSTMMGLISSSQVDEANTAEELIQRLVIFLSAGMRA